MNSEDRFKSREEHIAYINRRISEFLKPIEEKTEDPWTEDAIRIVGEKIIAKILAEEGKKKQ